MQPWDESIKESAKAGSNVKLHSNSEQSEVLLMLNLRSEGSCMLHANYVKGM